MNTRCFACLTGVLVVTAGVPFSYGQTIEWTRQFGTSFSDYSNGVSVDEMGNIFIVGYTEGALDGTNAGNSDAYVSKFDADENLIWTRQLGTLFKDIGNGISTDKWGNVFITGFTEGILSGTNAGGTDAFVSKFDTDGNLAWTQQFGTPFDDAGNGVSIDRNGSVYVAGYTFGDLDGASAGGLDTFVSKYDTNGNLDWTRQLGTSRGDISLGISVDGKGSVFVSGVTEGALDGDQAGGSDAFLSKFDEDGNLDWSRQLGTSRIDFSLGVSADAKGNVFISGFTQGGLTGTNAGKADAFVSKYDREGNLNWTRQIGTRDSDVSRGVFADELGNIFISGEAGDNLGGFNGERGAFVSKLDTNGNIDWTQQLGNDREISYVSYGVISDGIGNVYISGTTLVALDSTNTYDSDAFIVKIKDLTFVPEPSTALLMLTATITLATRRRAA